MNKEFLKKIGINDDDPKVVLSKLGSKEIELLDKRDLAETNGAVDRVEEIDRLLEQLKAERQCVKKEARSSLGKKENVSSSKDKKQVANKKKKDAYDKFVKKKTASNKRSSVTKNNQQTSTSSNYTNSSSSTPKKTSSNIQSTNSNQSTSKGNAQQTTTSQPTNVASTMPVNNTNPYSEGLRYYQSQNYKKAFECFLSVAEKKSVSDQTEEAERTQASYLLVKMYKNGEGTNVDLDRSKHYLKRAADFGYNQAQFEYAVLVFSQNTHNTSSCINARKEGWKYLEQAADSGLLEAQKKYISMAMESSDTNASIINKAKSYVSLIRNQLDSFEEKKCDDWINGLDEKEKEKKRIASYPRKFVIGEILFLIGTVYLFKGLNPTFFQNSIPHISKFIIDIPDFLIFKWGKLVTWTEPYMTYQGIFGGWLILIGNAVRGMGVKYVKTSSSKCEDFGNFIRIIVIVLCVVHFIANFIETGHLFGNGGYMQFLAMIANILIGRLLGTIISA